MEPIPAMVKWRRLRPWTCSRFITGAKQGDERLKENLELSMSLSAGEEEAEGEQDATDGTLKASSR